MDVKVDVSPAGSKTAAWYQMENMGTRETQDALPKGVCDIKPINGKIVQTAFRESDQFVVLLKQGNSCGAKEDPNCKFTSLAHLLAEDFLKECFRELKKNKSPGIDGILEK